MSKHATKMEKWKTLILAKVVKAFSIHRVFGLGPQVHVNKPALPKHGCFIISTINNPKLQRNTKNRR